MFNTLETTWDTSARRGWSAAASFTLQALALSLLLAIPLIWVQGPPRLQWLQAVTMPLPMVSSAPSPILHDRYTRTSISTPINPMIAPRYIPRTIQVDNGVAEPAPNLGFVNVGPNARSNAPYIPGQNIPVVVLRPSAPTHPVRVSHWAEGNIIYRVQPLYPTLAKQAGIQGIVQLRAIISKTGTIERLTLESGHPMLSASAIAAVKQWRYRPYLLNDEPVEVETEITVNFTLAR